MCFEFDKNGDYKPFVSHRVGEIQERTNVEEWQWAPTEWNISYGVTRSKINGKKFRTNGFLDLLSYRI